ncbi:MAG: T9SS type B sorting domain-containing protein, partial [Bacteroidia bacterium]|nr:T9SS type B sorting domain-containing protein [Bacteroidia bacterium]
SWSNNKTTASITGLCPGNYTDTLTDANGCKLVQPFTIGANSTITLSTSQVNVPCNGGSNGSASVTASGGGGIYNYSWSPGLQTSQSVSGLSSGSYTIMVTDQNGCQGTDTLYITQPTAIAINLMVTPDSCNGSCDGRIIANVSGGTPSYLYNWSPGPSSADSIKGLCPGTYSVNVTDNNGCTATANVTLINPPLFTESHLLTRPSCNSSNDGAISITPAGGIAPYTYTWSPNGLTSSSASNLSMGTYTILVTDSTGCTLKDTITLIPDTNVIAIAGNDTGICAGTGFLTLNGSRSSPTGVLTYSWIDSNSSAVLGNTAIITITAPAGTTTYELVTTDGSCTDTARVKVTIVPGPTASGGPDQHIFIYNSVQIGGSPTGPSGSTYRWRPPTGLNDSTISNPIASPTVTTTYTVFVTNALGCTSSDTITVFILPQIVIWDGFTPNGDGMNDVWDIGNINEFPDAVVEIYNRWGELLYRTQGYYKPWDGMYNNEPVPVGTYYYIINLNDPRFPKAYTGPLTIQR